MAKLTVTQGRNMILQHAYQATGYSSSRYIRTMSIDDNSTGFSAGHTALDSAGTVSNLYDAAFDATPSAPASGQVSVAMTTGTSNGNFTQRRFAQHNDTAANVTASSTTLIMGIDGQSITKTSDFNETITQTTSLASA